MPTPRPAFSILTTTLSRAHTGFKWLLTIIALIFIAAWCIGTFNIPIKDDFGLVRLARFSRHGVLLILSRQPRNTHADIHPNMRFIVGVTSDAPLWEFRVFGNGASIEAAVSFRLIPPLLLFTTVLWFPHWWSRRLGMLRGILPTWRARLAITGVLLIMIPISQFADYFRVLSFGGTGRLVLSVMQGRTSALWINPYPLPETPQGPQFGDPAWIKVLATPTAIGLQLGPTRFTLAYIFALAILWITPYVARVRSASLNLCPHCRYDRTGLAPQTLCPECGTSPVSPTAS